MAHVRAVEWRGGEQFLITSENAAPFARIVAAKRPALYTEGYPNGTVQQFLQTIGDAGVEAEEIALLLARGCWYEQEAFPL